MCKNAKFGIILYKCKKMNRMNKNAVGKVPSVWNLRLDYLILEPNVPCGTEVPGQNTFNSY